MIELGRRAVACKGWRWRCGMLISDGTWFSRVGSGYNWKSNAELLPDLTDPATLGCLLALVREAYKNPYASIWYNADYNHSGDRWSYYSKQVTFSGYATEAEALVVALESAL
jgi:hypothetical protein